jgi:hypothetical protein
MNEASEDGKNPIALVDGFRLSKVVLSHEELALLVGGIDLAATRRRRWYRNTSFSEAKIA